MTRIEERRRRGLVGDVQSEPFKYLGHEVTLRAKDVPTYDSVPVKRWLDHAVEIIAEHHGATKMRDF